MYVYLCVCWWSLVFWIFGAARGGVGLPPAKEGIDTRLFENLFIRVLPFEVQNILEEPLDMLFVIMILLKICLTVRMVKTWKLEIYVANTEKNEDEIEIDYCHITNRSI